MFGLSSIGAGLALKLAAGGLVLALAGGAVAYVQGLRATIADQRTMINEVSAERDRERATAEHNAEMSRRMAASQAAAIADRADLEKRLRQSRQKTATTVQELQREPSISDPLPRPLRPLLRRVQ